MGQRGDELLYRQMVVPCRKGSVFDAFICSEIERGVMMRTSLKHRVVVGSYLWMCVDVYSETRRNP